MHIFAFCVPFVWLTLIVARIDSLSVSSHPKSTTWNVHLTGSQVLSCLISSPQRVEVGWLKNGKRIRASDRIAIRTTDGGHDQIVGVLEVTTIQKSDEGKYACTARYGDQTVQSNAAVLTIYGPPSVNSGNPLVKNLYVSWDDAFSLQCDGKGPPAITKVMWNYKVFSDDDGKNVLLRGTQPKSLSNTRLSILPREDDAMSKKAVRYDVSCIVENIMGSETSGTTAIHIKRNPEKPRINQIIPLSQGRTADLYWEFGFNGYDEILSCSSEIRGKDFAQTSSLDINNLSKVKVFRLVKLVPMTSYTVRIKCRNSVGASPWTEEQSFTTKEGFPDQAPRSMHVDVVNSTSLKATWLPIEKGHIFGMLLGYKARLLKAGRPIGKMQILSTSTLKIYFSNLAPGQKYCVTVLGFTKVRDGEQSIPKCVTLPQFERLEPPVIKDIKAAPGKVTFTYSNGHNQKGALQNCSIVMHDPENHEYRVQIDISDGIAERTMRNLPPNSQYESVIQCFSSTNKPVLSEKWTFKTSEEKPRDSPAGLQLRADDEKRVLQALWDPFDVDTLNGNFTGYNICITTLSNEMKCDLLGSSLSNYTFAAESMQTYSISVAACTNAGCGPSAYKVGIANWKIPSTASPPAPNQTTVFASAHVTIEGHFSFIYVGIAVLAVAIVIMIVVLVCRKHAKKKNERTLPAVVFTPSNGVAEYGQVSAASTPASPSNANSSNVYYTPLLASHPLLSKETLAKLEGLKFSRDRLILGERLGKGEFGRVYKAKFQPDVNDNETMEVAVKTMIMDEYDASEREEFVKEGLRMRDMDHPNVMRLIGICLPEEDKSAGVKGDARMSGYEAISPLVVVPYMANGDLKHYLYTARDKDETKHLTLNRLLCFAHDIVNGMEYLASRNIVHRDLACRNCMLDENMRVVVSDFGLSRQIYSTNYYRQKRAAKMPVKWMALESLVDRIYSSSTDVWAFGVTAWEIFTFCQNPYPGVQNHEMHELLKAGTRLKQPNHCPQNIWNDAIYVCWDPRPEERPTFAELVDMFTGYLKSYPATHDSEASNAPVYANVQPPEDYETLVVPSDPLLRSNTISSEYNEVPMAYDTALERLPSGKIIPRQGRDRGSSKRPLLGPIHSDDSDIEGDNNVVNL